MGTMKQHLDVIENELEELEKIAQTIDGMSAWDISSKAKAAEAAGQRSRVLAHHTTVLLGQIVEKLEGAA